MPPTSHLLAFAVTAFVIILIPGPSVLFTVSRAIVLGRVAGVATVAGNTVGAFTQVVAVAFGIGPLIERSIALFTVLKLAGACYLIFLGVQAVRHRHSLAEALGKQVERKTTARIVIDGFTVGVTNPKVVVFFSAILPQFVDRQAGNVPVQIIMLGAIFAGVALLSDSGWALAAGTGRHRPHLAVTFPAAACATRRHRRARHDRHRHPAGIHRTARLGRPRWLAGRAVRRERARRGGCGPRCR
jgi:threonine/homoserine/homoserine lactone efflux protein